MTVNKTQALLFIFYRLLTFKKVTKEEVLSEVEVSEITFKRYIQELRAYFRNFNIGYAVDYDRKTNAYYLNPLNEN